MFFSPLGQPKLRFIKPSNLGNLVVVVSMHHADVTTCCSSILHQFLRWIIWLIGFPRAIFTWNGLMYFKTSASLKVVIENSDGVKGSPWSRHRGCFCHCGSLFCERIAEEVSQLWFGFIFATQPRLGALLCSGHFYVLAHFYVLSLCCYLPWLGGVIFFLCIVRFAFLQQLHELLLTIWVTHGDETVGSQFSSTSTSTFFL